MSRNESELTSALFDDQIINADEIEALLDDEQAIQEWHRYSVIRAAVKSDLNAGLSLDISEQVRLRVEQESNKIVTPGFARSKSQSKAASRWFQPFAKVAVAASVAVVAVMTVQTYQQPVTPQGSAEPALLTSPIGGGREPVSLNRVEPMSQINDQQRRRQVQSYLIDHQQQLMLQQKADKADSEEQPEQELNKGN